MAIRAAAQLPGQSVLEVSYVGNRGVRQRISRNLDSLPNQYLSTSPFRDQATINLLSAQVPNPFYPLLPGTSLLRDDGGALAIAAGRIRSSPASAWT